MAVIRFSGCFKDADSFKIAGSKIGFELVYTSSNTLTLKKGACHVNDGTSDYWVTKDTSTSITSATTGWPGVGAGAYVTIKPNGTITLRASTCTASTRPSDNLFQLTGGSVGYDDIGKFAYYYDADERVIAHFWEVSATSFYFINLGSGKEEIGENSFGYWKRDAVKNVMRQYGSNTQTSNASGNNFFGSSSGTTQYNATSYSWPVPFASVKSAIATMGTSAIGYVTHLKVESVTQYSIRTGSGADAGASVAFSWQAVGLYS